MSAQGLPPARHRRRPPFDRACYDVVTLAHDERVLRRRRLVTAHGEGVLVDLPRTLRLEHGDALALEDGRLLEVIAAEEPLLEVRGDLVRLAWHIGNRHLPCQIEEGRLLVGRDRVVLAMLLGLGAALREVSEPFVPEGGAYGEEAHGHSPRGDDLGLGDLASVGTSPGSGP